MMRPPIILLKEGTENKQGKQQIISNINACQVSHLVVILGIELRQNWFKHALQGDLLAHVAGLHTA